MENLAEKIEKLRDKMKDKPPEKQLQMLWSMFAAMTYAIDQLQTYDEAWTKAIVQYVKDCGESVEKTALTRLKIMQQLADVIVGLEEESQP